MAKRQSVIKQLFSMILAHKSYWLFPMFAIIAVLIILTLLASFGGGAMAPFIYTLF